MTTEIEAVSAAQAMLVDQLRDAHEYGDAQRARADRLQAELDKKVLEIASIVRQSEGAKLERERLATEVRRGEQALERLQMEVSCKLQLQKARLATVEQTFKPFFDWAWMRLGVAAIRPDEVDYEEGFRAGQQLAASREPTFVPSGKSRAWWRGWCSGMGVVERDAKAARDQGGE